MIFVTEASGSITRENFQCVVDFTKSLTMQLPVFYFHRNRIILFYTFSLSECREPADVIFVLDASGSITRENFQFVVDFTKAVIMQLPVDEGTNVGLMTYGDAEEVNMHAWWIAFM